MIYLIGGAMRVGKSILAKAIAEKTQAELIATDDVCRAAIKKLSPEEKDKQYPLRSFKSDPAKNTVTPEDNVERQIVTAQSLIPELDRIISEAISQKRTLVIEGVFILPHYVHSLIEKYGPQNVHAVFVGSKHIEHIINGIKKNTSPNNWMKESNPEVIRQVAALTVAFSQRIQEDADEYHLEYVERTENFEKDKEQLQTMLMDDKEMKLPLR